MKKIGARRASLLAIMLPSAAALAALAVLPASAAAASVVPAYHDRAQPAAVHAPAHTFTIPAHLSARARAADRVTTGPDGSKLPAAAASCAWYTIAAQDSGGGHVWDQNDLQLLVSVLGQCNSSGGYCGLASDHVCAEPTDSTYTGGLVIFNYWIADGGSSKTRQDRFGVKRESDGLQLQRELQSGPYRGG